MSTRCKQTEFNIQKIILNKPSHNVAFTPRNGKLLAQLRSKPLAGPPLSVVKTITLFSIIPVETKASYTYNIIKMLVYHCQYCFLHAYVMEHVSLNVREQNL